METMKEFSVGFAESFDATLPKEINPLGYVAFADIPDGAVFILLGENYPP